MTVDGIMTSLIALMGGIVMAVAVSAAVVLRSRRRSCPAETPGAATTSPSSSREALPLLLALRQRRSLCCGRDSHRLACRH